MNLPPHDITVFIESLITLTGGEAFVPLHHQSRHRAESVARLVAYLCPTLLVAPEIREGCWGLYVALPKESRPHG